MAEKETPVTVDRLEDGWVVVETPGGSTTDLDALFFPEGVEGGKKYVVMREDEG